MDETLWINGKKCVAVLIVYIDGNALLMHNPVKQTLSASITRVKKCHLMSVLKQDEEDEIITKLSDFFDLDRDPITSAYAYAALKNASTQFKFDITGVAETFNLVRSKCILTQEIFDNNNKNNNIVAFSLKLEGLPQELLHEISTNFILVEKSKIYTKPSLCDNMEMEVFYAGLRFTSLSGICTLLFWESRFII